MSASPSPPVGTASPEVWPRCAQLTASFLLGTLVTLLAVRTLGSIAWTARPLQLDHGAVVDLDSADRAELLQLPGIGEHRVQRIQAGRDVNPLSRPDDLRQVKGFGPVLVDKVRPHVRNDGPGPGAGSAAGRKEWPTTLIDVNRASESDLQRLPGVGPVLASRIVAARQAQRFQRIDDLRRVKGIGPKTLDALRPFVTVGPSPVVMPDEL